MKNGWKKILPLVLAAAMSWSAVPASAFAADNATTETETQAELTDATEGVDFTTEPTEETVYKVGTGTVTYTPATESTNAVITLDHAAFKGTGKDNHKRAILVKSDAEYQIILKGANTAEGFDSVIGSGNGNVENAKVTVSGEGKLSVKDCNYLIHSLRNITFDGVQVDADVTLSNILIVGIAEFRNNAQVQFTSHTDYNANIQAGSGVKILSGSNVELTGPYAGIYRSALYYSEGNEGVTVKDSTLTVKGTANDKQNFGMVSENNPITLENSKVQISGMQFGIYSTIDSSRLDKGQDNHISVTGTTDLQISDATYGIYPNGTTLTFDGESSTVINAKYGILSRDTKISDDAELEITGTEAVNLRASGADLSGHNSCVALVNTEAVSDDASEWDQQTTLDGYKYFRIRTQKTVIFDTGDGSKVEEQIVFKGEPAKKPADPSVQNGTFLGWYLDANYETEWNFEENSVETDLTLYAKWMYHLTDVSVEQKEPLYYTGEAQSAEVITKATAVHGENVVFTYATEENGVYSETIPTFTEAGTYTVYYKANAENHYETTGTFTVTIKKSTIDANGDTLDNTEKTLTKTDENLQHTETAASENATNKNTTGTSTKAPKTGDSGQMAVWFLIVLASAGILAAAGRKRYNEK